MSWTVENPGPLIAFSGSRKFTEQAVVEKAMRRLVKRWPHCLIRVGDAKAGLDPMAAQEATRWGKWPDVQECYWPPWPSTKAMRWEAAHERNGRVIQDAHLLVAFYAPGSKTSGTTDAITQAKARGIVVYVYHEGHWETIMPGLGRAGLQGGGQLPFAPAMTPRPGTCPECGDEPFDCEHRGAA